MAEIHGPGGDTGGDGRDVRADEGEARWFRYVPHGSVGEFEAQGWVISADLGPPHSHYAVLMEYEGDGKEPRRAP